MGTNKILLLENIHPAATDHLKKSGFSVENMAKALGDDELKKKLASEDYLAVGIRSKTQLTAEILDAVKNIHAIGAFCIGTNQIDLDKANKNGIPAFNAPYSSTRSVAELVIGEIIALARRFCDQSKQVHQGVWEKSAKGSIEVRGKTLGIVGYGHIGSQISVLAEAIGMNVIFYDIIKKLPLGNSKPTGSLDDLLKNSDFVSLHVPATEMTKNMIGKSQFKIMREHSYLINASRGSVVVIEDLVDALKSGKLAGTAVDVFPDEPESNNEKFSSGLQGLPNVIMTPHVGGSTEEAQEAIGLEVAESLIRYLKLGSTYGSVNFPSVDPGQKKPECQRIVNVHKNVPGVLSDINGIVSKIGANIEAQHLSTDPNIGYLVMDFARGPAEQLIQEINKLKTSIRTYQI